MPQCPHCQAPYETGQRYCSVCGSFLLHPEDGDTFCPQCGVRVSPRQEFCHECDAPLKGEGAAAETPTPAAPAAAAPEPSRAAPADTAPAPKMQPWVMGVLIGGGVAIIILLVLLFSRGTSTPPEHKAVPPAATAPAPVPAPAVTPAPPAPAPPAKEAPGELKDQLGEVLNNLRDAQLNKDILKFMSVYSLTFPELDQKRATTLKSWENYDYTNLVFTINKVQVIDPNNAIAQVTWYIDTRNRRNQELASVSQSYEVRFAKEMGHWRIRSLEEAE
jgi:uncharacterized Zn finger protein (UPF0148 family)